VIGALEPHDMMRLRNADCCNADYRNADYRNTNYHNANYRNTNYRNADKSLVPYRQVNKYLNICNFLKQIFMWQDFSIQKNNFKTAWQCSF
jgi:uncharacterized protein YjbI with pentapeptide repeats